MNTITIIDIILTALVIIFAIINAYRKMGKTIQSKATFLIAEAAELDILGPEKMQRVVDELYEKYVPDFFKSFMTKQKLEEIAQKIYDNMKLFAKNDVKDTGQEADSCKLPASNETTQNEASGSYPHIENRFQQVK